MIRWTALGIGFLIVGHETNACTWIMCKDNKIPRASLIADFSSPNYELRVHCQLVCLHLRSWAGSGGKKWAI